MADQKKKKEDRSLNPLGGSLNKIGSTVNGGGKSLNPLGKSLNNINSGASDSTKAPSGQASASVGAASTTARAQASATPAESAAARITSAPAFLVAFAQKINKLQAQRKSIQGAGGIKIGVSDGNIIISGASILEAVSDLDSSTSIEFSAIDVRLDDLETADVSLDARISAIEATLATFSEETISVCDLGAITFVTK